MKPQLKVGLEIHTQLQTLSKLFASSPNPTSNLNLPANTTTAFFDVSLPGTQPRLNPECVLNSLKLACSLNCNIPPVSSFDRKHYFYGDQPLGYQITQHYQPIARNGSITLLQKHHLKIKRDLTVRIQQLQLEQDTGRSIYHAVDSDISNIDFNRANIPLVEMVTLPDFQDVEEVRAFLQTYIKLVQDLQVCTGDLETGALRVDVNINVTGHERVEIKNLPTISAIVNAIRYEAKRQTKAVLDAGATAVAAGIETRGWDGRRTYHLRNKESAVDYRYVPDMELPKVKLDVDSLVPQIQALLPQPISERLDILMSSPKDGGHSLTLRDARILVNNDALLQFYTECWNNISDDKVRLKLINWLVHELLGTLTKSEVEFSPSLISSDCFTDLIVSVESGGVTKPNGKLLLLHLVNNREDQQKKVLEIAKEFGMLASKTADAQVSSDVENVVNEIIAANTKVVDEIQNKGKVKKVNFLIGLCMRQTGGNVQPQVFEEKIKQVLGLHEH